VLSESSYLTAIYIYLGSAGVLIVYVGWWLSRHWRAAWVTLVVLLLAALLLTPAYPKEGVQTMAPALVVAAFQYLTVGPEGAAHAVRPLVFMSGAAVLITLLFKMTVFRGRRAAADGKNPPVAKPNSGPPVKSRNRVKA
jgi:hypothetical protein